MLACQTNATRVKWVSHTWLYNELESLNSFTSLAHFFSYRIYTYIDFRYVYLNLISNRTQVALIPVLQLTRSGSKWNTFTLPSHYWLVLRKGNVKLCNKIKQAFGKHVTRCLHTIFFVGIKIYLCSCWCVVLLIFLKSCACPFCKQWSETRLRVASKYSN